MWHEHHIPTREMSAMAYSNVCDCDYFFKYFLFENVLK
jgi:hypothetical protein